MSKRLRIVSSDSESENEGKKFLKKGQSLSSTSGPQVCRIGSLRYDPRNALSKLQ
jgi:hypothetical protein